MKIGWALDMIGWARAQPFPTLATPLYIRDNVQSQCFGRKVILKCDGDSKLYMNATVVAKTWHGSVSYIYHEQ